MPARSNGSGCSEMECRVCNNSENNRLYRAREMMFGLKDQFVYFECARCRCLQIAQVPDDMTRYYPPYYYSFNNAPSREERDLAGRLVDYYLARAAITPDWKILDVGCGGGGLLRALREAGFANLMGVDPYIRQTLEYGGGLRVLKGTLGDVGPEWDLIMFHHSFEHLADPLETLEAVSSLLSGDGVCLIRIPTVSSYAWRHYRTDWVQLDAPRHLFLHSTESLEMISERAGLEVGHVIYDSEAFQFWGSEQYRRDIPLFSAGSYMVNPSGSIFSQSQIREFEHNALQLNLEKQGDQAAFCLTKR